MGLKPDHWIRKMALEHGMIEPFVDKQVRQGVISRQEARLDELAAGNFDALLADSFIAPDACVDNDLRLMAMPPDLDQAFLIEPSGDDLLLHYALSDVGWFVRHGDAIDGEFAVLAAVGLGTDRIGKILRPPGHRHQSRRAGIIASGEHRRGGFGDERSFVQFCANYAVFLD